MANIDVSVQPIIDDPDYYLVVKAGKVRRVAPADVGFSGNYADLSGTPTFAAVATSGAYADLSGKPTLATIATTGQWSDLIGAPAIGTAAALNTGTSAGNIPVLDGSGKLLSSILPLIAINDTFAVASQAAMLALTAEKGDMAIRSDIHKTFVLSTNSPSTLADWLEIESPTAAVSSVAGLTGAISASNLKTNLAIAAADVTGLGAVAYSNTYSDLSGKPTLGTAAAKNFGTADGNLVEIQTGGKLPALDASNLTNVPGGGGGGGSGDVTGPASAVVGRVPIFSNINGKVISDGGVLLSALALTSSLGTAAALNSGTSSGNVPVLDGSGKLVTSILPDSIVGAMNYQGTWNATTNTPTIPTAAAGNKGQFYIVATAGTTTIGGVSDWQIGDWIVSSGASWSKIDSSDQVNSVAGLQGTISAANLKTALTLVKGDVGLGNVDNTADSAKPVSTAQAAADALKLNAANPTSTGKFTTAASATGGAGFNLPHGADPTTPVNGDVWTKTGGLYSRINGATQGPYITATSLPAIATAAEVSTGTENTKIVSAKTLADAVAITSTTGSGSYAANLATTTNTIRRIANGNSTLGTPTNPIEGRTYTFLLKQDATGGRTWAYSSVFDFGSAGAPTPSTGANKEDAVTAICIDAATPKFLATFWKAA